MPAAEWWAPLLVDLAAIQRGSISVGLRIDTVDLTGEVPQVAVSWSTGARGTLPADPKSGRTSLIAEIAAIGPVQEAPRGHDDEFWVPDNDASPLLGHAWLLDDLGRHSDAWNAYVDEPVRLLQINTDGKATMVAVGRSTRRDVVEVRVLVKDWQLAIGCGYTIVERAVTSSTPNLVLTVG